MPLKNTNSLTLDGFENEEAFVEFVRDARQGDLDFDRRNRDRGIDDSRYAAGFQWPLEDYNWRVENNIPAMTFNMVPSLLRHRLGARARKRIGPKIMPQTPGDRYDGIAQIREGIIRNIELNSDIQIVDSIVSQNQLIAGIANYEVSIEYANADVFETDIRIRSDQNAWSVIWDSQAQDPTGKDARHCIKETVLTRKDFERMFPKAQALDIGPNPGAAIVSATQVTTDGKNGVLSDWVNQDTVRIAVVWIMRQRKKNIALLTNGDVVDIGDTPPEEFSIEDGNGGAHTVVQDPKTGEYKWRESEVKYAKGYLTNGMEILAEPYEMEIDRVPIVRVPAWLINTGDRTERFGMVNFAKDAITFYNYVKSDRIERIVYRNRAQYSAQEDALSAEQEKQYKNAHRLRGGVLKYRGPKPEQIETPPVDQAAIIETQAAQESIYEIFDIQPGGVGGGQTAPSGISLEHQMNITDTGGLIYDEMMVSAKREVYRIINQLISYVYDAPRIIKIVGSDGKIKEAILNDPENPESVDITSGKYATDVTTGPSYDTMRVQATSMIETAMNANPEIIPVALPKWLKLLNVPGMEDLIQALEEMAGAGEMTPEQQAIAQAQAEKEQAIQDKLVELEIRSKELDVSKKEAETEAKLADAQAKYATAESERAQAQERLAKSEQDRISSESKVAEMSKRIDLLIAQTEKVWAEIERLNATPLPQPTPPGGNNP